MAVDDALRIARGTRGVAHRGRVALVERRPLDRVRRAGEEILVADDRRERRRGQRAVPHDDVVADARELLRMRLECRHERVVDEQHAVLRVVHDVADLLREEPDVDRVEHGARRRHAEVELQVAVRVPRERADAIARPDAERPERVGEPGRPPCDVAVGVAEDAAGGARRHRALGIERPRPLEDGRDRELRVHHQSAHRALLRKSISVPARRSGASKCGWWPTPGSTTCSARSAARRSASSSGARR